MAARQPIPADDTTTPEALLARLARFGVKAWEEVLLCLPLDYEALPSPTTLGAVCRSVQLLSAPQLFGLIVTEHAVVVPKPLTRVLLSATDGALNVRISVFQDATDAWQTWKGLRVGQRIDVLGRLQNWNGRLALTNPEWINAARVGVVTPRYPSRRGVLAEGALFEATRHALAHHLDATIAHLRCTLRPETRAWCPEDEWSQLLRAAHAPSCPASAEAAFGRLRDLATRGILDHARALRVRDPQPASAYAIAMEAINALAARLPYPLTDDQTVAIQEICADLASPMAMRRVLSGDVGTGKTLTFMLPAVALQQMNAQVVVLTPNSVLAHQFARECAELFGDTVPVALVTSSSPPPQLDTNPIIVGTSAILARLKNVLRPSLIVIDEQQKWSVAQKSCLQRIDTNLLEATATPIPRTAALITHGGMDISILRQGPFARSIQTRVVGAQDSARLFSHTRRVIESGAQTAVIYPVVEGASRKDKRAVLTAAQQWESHFPGQVVALHGALSEAEKLAAIASLIDGSKRIVVSSTVIELGVTLPNLKSMVIVEADRHGSGTLHQLRGRVARKGGVGYCFLFLPRPVPAATMARLRLLEAHNDGFTLAEQDAELRGYGDLFEEGQRQHGVSRSTVFRCVDIRPADIHRLGSEQVEGVPC